jgi:hypothetical protein
MSFSEKERAILDYIRDHPNCTKQQLVEALTEEGISSRVPILREVNKLEQQKVIKVIRKKANSQIHYLRINDDSLLLSVIKETEEIKKAFFTILDEVKHRWNAHQGESPNDYKLTPIAIGLTHVEVSIEMLFRHFIMIYILHSLFTWPQKVGSRDTSNRLYEIFFDNIQEIQTKFFESFNLESREQAEGDIASGSWVLRQEQLEGAVENFKSLDLGRQAEPLLDSLWRAGSDFLPYVKGIGIHNLKRSIGGEKARRSILADVEEIKYDWRKMLKK